uniref:Uncharacterized LOC100176117 n=1 Tax=Ciona intestinalis TaxID=7719 RepID=F6QPI8_CIOIN|nr:uncharacterized protein LOC100176117 [Ciona intestinalis]|eukprot:XP_002131828.1 uncharacterized protein LOC100176117 [Ciona intestinalis]
MGSMGTYHSTLNCDRFGFPFQNCFGYAEPGTEYENNATEKNTSQLTSNGSTTSANSNHVLVDNAPTKRRSRKLSRARDSCCTGSTAIDEDFSYDLYNPPNHVQTRSNCRRLESVTSHHSSNSAAAPSDNVKGTDLAMDSRDSHVAGIFLTSTESSVDPPTTVATVTNNNVKDSDCSTVVPTVHCLVSSPEIEVQALEIHPTQEKLDVSKVVVEKKSPVLSDTKEEESTSYFRSLVVKETEKLNDLIEKWNTLPSKHMIQCPTDIRDEIRTVIGQTRLVITERFTQFTTLIDRADGKNGCSKDDRPVLLSDLRGFWDMIYFQVEDVMSKFSALQKVADDGWKRAETDKKKTAPVTSKKTATKRGPKKNTGAGKPKTQSAEEEKKRREAARKRLAEARKAAQAKLSQEKVSPSSLEILTTSSLPGNNSKNVDVSINAANPTVVPCHPETPDSTTTPSPNPTPSPSEKSLESVDGDFPRASTPRIESSSCSVSHVAISVDSASISSVPSSVSLVH